MDDILEIIYRECVEEFGDGVAGTVHVTEPLCVFC